MGHKATLVSLDGLSKEVMVPSPVGQDIVMAHCPPFGVDLRAHEPNSLDAMGVRMRRYHFYRTEPVHIYKEVYEKYGQA
jgi:hypothetical protein